jgi:hypothetical protein
MSNKQKKYHIYVNYFIQNDSWESISHPNLFVLPQEFTNLNDVKAKMVYDNFPLINKESFYLRFFLDDKTQGVKGWVDFPPNAVIPIYNEGHVYVKVLRLPKGTKINFKNQDVYKPKDTSRVNKGNSPNLIFMDDQKNPPKQPMAQPQASSGFDQNMFSELNKEFSNLGNFNQNSNGAQVPPPEPQQQPPQGGENQNNANTINIDDWGAFTGNNGSVGGVNMDSGSQSNSTNDMNKVDPNLFNVFNNINLNQPAPNQPTGMDSPGYDFTANLDPKKNKMYPIDNIPNTLPDDEIKERVDPIINKWILGGEGKKNLLFLLTTLHEVWTNSKLTIPDMQTLVNDKAAVRTWYKKAMRELHADKNRDKDFKTKYIAASLYQILNEANSNY